MITGSDIVLDGSAARRAEELSTRYGASKRFHKADFIFEFIYNKPDIVDRADAVTEYFDSGHATAELLKSVLSEHGIQLYLNGDRPQRRLRVLEFAAGYGRVTRHFPASLPEVDVVACDIHEAAVKFLAELGHAAVRSQHDPNQFDLGETFDVIFVFSFFTHMPKATWGRWLQVLGEHLAPNGVLVFTTHGEVSRKLMGISTLDPDGFHFHAISEQKDLDTSEYGNCVTAFEFVAAQVERASLSPLLFKEAGAGHHDVHVVRQAATRESPQGRQTPLRAADAEIEALRSSTSWRITKPLRVIAGFIRSRRSS